MNYEITHLMGAELSTPLIYQLHPVISAYRPHDKPPTEEQLDAEDKKEKESPVGKLGILDTYKAVKYNQDLTHLENKRKYNEKWRGYRTWYSPLWFE